MSETTAAEHPGDPARIRLSRRKGWRKPDGAIVVTRPGRWGNPFPVRRWGLEDSMRMVAATLDGRWDRSVLPDATDEDFVEATAAHDAWTARLGGDPAARARADLRGHDLACWCPPDRACHADLLLAAANGSASGEPAG